MTMRRPARSGNARRCEGLSERCDGNSADRDKLAVKCKTLHKWQSFYSLLMYGWPKAFPKQSSLKPERGRAEACASAAGWFCFTAWSSAKALARKRQNAGFVKR